MLMLKKKHDNIVEELEIDKKVLLAEIKAYKSRVADLEYKLGIKDEKIEKLENNEAYLINKVGVMENANHAAITTMNNLTMKRQGLEKENNNLKVDNNRLKTKNKTLESINVKVNKTNVEILRRLWCNGESKRQMEILEARVRNREYTFIEIANYINELRMRIGI